MASNWLSFTLLIIATLVLGIYLQKMEKRWFIGSIALLCIASWVREATTTQQVHVIFAVALTVSLIGDMFMAKWLRLTGKRIIDGIIFFGIAHILYIYGIQLLHKTLSFSSFIIGVAVAVPIYLVVAFDRSKRVLTIGAFFYSLIIGVLFATILMATIQTRTVVTLVQLGGITLFMLSDGIIAFREFRKELPFAEHWIASTYFVAQVLLQFSIVV